MPVLIEHVTDIVVTILVIVLLGIGTMIILAIARRQKREKYFERLDSLRERYGPVIEAILARKIEYERGVEALRGISGTDRLYFLEQLLFAKAVSPGQTPVLRQVCEDLGLVKIWQKHVIGQIDVASLRDALARPEGFLHRIGRLHFLLRAKSAEYLGVIQHRDSWPVLVKALDDPHPDVQTVAARSLAAIGEPKCFPALLERLHTIVLKPSSMLSLRSIKSTLVSFPLQEAGRLLPSLEHAHPRIRFLAVDIIREMVEREAAQEEEFTLDKTIFGTELAEVFLTRCGFDDNADVRARAAPVIAYLEDVRATPVLLTLLEDPLWFVRLHTVRALAKRKFLSRTDQIAERLTDSQWIVREAAARTLLVFGRVGVDRLSDHLLSTTDRYSREQVADEMQRAGLIPTLLAQYANDQAKRESRVFQQLAEMGKTSYLLSTLASAGDLNLRKKFLQEFGGSADLQIRAWVKYMASREADPELRALAASFVGSAISSSQEGN